MEDFGSWFGGWALIAAAGTGLSAGLAHALSGPDHMAAIAPLVVVTRRRRWLTGAVWGIGHAVGLWVLGFVLMFMRGFLPIAAISSWSERLVGIVLIAVGLWGLRKMAVKWVHTHEHVHEGSRHKHVHLHWPGRAHGAGQPGAHSWAGVHSHAAMGIGVLHGLASGSYILGVLPALILPSLTEAIGYLFTFGIGSIAGMTMFSWTVGRVADGLAGAKFDADGWLLSGSSVAAIAVGCFWLLL